jgi:ATP-dependent helicase/nuclease subunit A
MPELTNAQRHAVETDGIDLVVTAGAGSGKTLVLVERFLRLLSSPNRDLRSLLAVTFTEKAAREMRDRVRKEIDSNLLGASDAPSRQLWQAHRHRIDSARIGTIHSMCAKLLKENPAEAGLDPLFQVLDELETDVLLTETIESLLAQVQQEGAREIELLFALGAFTTADMLSLLLLDRNVVDHAWLSVPENGQEILSLWESNLIEEQYATVQSLLDNPEWQEGVSVFRSHAASDPSDKMEQQRQRLLALLDEASDSAPRRNVELFRAFRKGMSVGVGRRAAWGGGALAQVKEAIKTLRETYDEVKKTLDLELDELDARAADMLPQLRHLYERAKAAYWLAKDERYALDFHDLEIKAVELLEGYPQLQERYRDQLSSLLIDEFQDTNEIQRRILYALKGPDQGRLFIVGDGKQSIYGFRGADVSVLRKVENDISASGGEDIHLPQSFRSHPRLVSLANHLFEPIFGTDVGELEDFEVPYQNMVAVRDEPPWTSTGEIHIMPREDSDGNRLKADDARQWEGHIFGERITHMVNEGFQVWDRDNGHWRPCSYGDFAILLRTFTPVEIYEAALKEWDIPYMTYAGKGYFGRQEVRDVFNLLKVVSNTYDDLSLAGVLRSPLFSVSDETLFRLRSKGDVLWEAMGGDLLGIEADQRINVEFARGTILGLTALVGRVRVAQLAQEALGRTGYLATLSALPDGRRRRANVEKLLEMARRSDRVQLDEFLTYLGDLRAQEVREGEAVVEVENAVQIMTVHKAKGLQFPIVILPNASGATRGRTPPVLARPEYGVALKLRDEAGQWQETAAFSAAKAVESKKGLAEEKRLLYVAFTRASDYVRVSGQRPAKEGGNDWLSTILSALQVSLDHDGEVKYPGGTLLVRQYAEQPHSMERAFVRRKPATTLWEELAEAQYGVFAGVPALKPPLVERLDIDPLAMKEEFTATELNRLQQGEEGRKEHFERDISGLPEQIRRVTRLRPGERAPAWIVGDITHKAIGAWDVLTDEDLLHDNLRTWAVEEGLLDDVLINDAIKRSVGLLDRFKASHLYADMQTAPTRRHEVPFAFSLDGKVIRGVADALFRSRDRHWFIVDFKTDRIKREDVGEKTDEYLVQLGLYQGGIEKALGESPRVVVYYLFPGVAAEIDAGRLAAARDEVETLFSNLRP